MAKPAGRRALVIGGSLGGLMAGIILRRRGLDVDIFERSPSPLSGRGAGIVSHRQLTDALAAGGVEVDAAKLGVRVRERRAYDPVGNMIAKLPFDQVLTSWDRLFQLLRGAFPDERYRLGKVLVDVLQTDSGVTARFADGTEEQGDLLVGADGFRSTVRSILAPDVAPTYAGYVAWRGMVAEAEMSPQAHAALFDSFAFCLPDGEQMLGYPVAGPDNDLTPGRRRYNFVWYRPAARDAELSDLLTDAEGRRHSVSIPPPLIRPDVVASMRAAATRRLSPAFAEVVSRTQEPFFQPIYDHESDRLAFGRIALIGDAAFVARPHVGAGVAKAASDAMALGAALAAEAETEAALGAYETARLPEGRRIIARARELGAYMQAQLATEEERRDAAAYRSPDSVLLNTASLAFLDAA